MVNARTQTPTVLVHLCDRPLSHLERGENKRAFREISLRSSRSASPASPAASPAPVTNGSPAQAAPAALGSPADSPAEPVPGTWREEHGEEGQVGEGVAVLIRRQLVARPLSGEEGHDGRARPYLVTRIGYDMLHVDMLSVRYLTVPIDLLTVRSYNSSHH